MNSTNRTIHIISGDAAVARACVEELAAFGGRYRTPVSSSIAESRQAFVEEIPAVVFVDESAIDSAAGETLETALAWLTENAPVVVAAAPEKQTDLAFLITSGAVDFVARTGEYLPIVAGLLDRRARKVEQGAGPVPLPREGLAGEFGEILRHEVNNPLTGILGNTELLLARRDRLPPAAVERLETIAELAVRLRETVRRLSNAWEDHPEHARQA